MTPKIKLIIQISIILLIVALTSFATRKFNDWFPPKTEIKIVFEGSTFSTLPGLKPLKDKTTYYFKNCDFTGRQYGETITNDEVDEAISKLDEKGKK
jgi:hypothetical protein